MPRSHTPTTPFGYYSDEHQALVKAFGGAAAEYFFIINGVQLDAADGALEALTLDVAKGDVEVEALAIWFRQRLLAG